MKWARVRDGTLGYFEFLAEFPTIQTQIQHWLTIGLKVSSSRTTETCRRLLAADPNLWRFVSVPGLEPTNNSAERALRHPVIWRRNSHGTQSDGGSRFVERILTGVETCRQQQRPVFDFLRDALIAYRTGQLYDFIMSTPPRIPYIVTIFDRLPGRRTGSYRGGYDGGGIHRRSHDITPLTETASKLDNETLYDRDRAVTQLGQEVAQATAPGCTG
jgi:hypothetical protein